MKQRQFAPVCNLEIATYLEEQGLWGDYHLLVEPIVRRDLTGWGNFLYDLRENKGRDLTIILDNGMPELGKPADLERLEETYDMLEPDFVILPDVINDMPETICRSLKAIHDFDHSIPLEKMMGVCQGHSAEHALCTAEVFVRAGLGGLAISKFIQPLIGSRAELTRKASKWGKPIHQLGFSTNLQDDLRSAQIGNAMGIDSAVPIWYPKELSLASYDPTIRRPDNYDGWCTWPSKHIQANLEWVRRCLR